MVPTSSSSLILRLSSSERVSSLARRFSWGCAGSAWATSFCKICVFIAIEESRGGEMGTVVGHSLYYSEISSSCSDSSETFSNIFKGISIMMVSSTFSKGRKGSH
jgi:hypothetical protein